MTTLVTVKASGRCYPARLIKTVDTPEGAQEAENVLIPSGYSYEIWVGAGQAITVTEEYHPDGYPVPECRTEGKA